MAKESGIYKCEVCGNIVEVLHASGGTLVCCGENMTYNEENSADAANEKHVPVVEPIEQGVQVSVGSVLHPMTEEHYIEWIELSAAEKLQRQVLKPYDEPVAVFKTDENGIVTARAYCNLHGLWES